MNESQYNFSSYFHLVDDSARLTASLVETTVVSYLDQNVDASVQKVISSVTGHIHLAAF